MKIDLEKVKEIIKNLERNKETLAAIESALKEKKLLVRVGTPDFYVLELYGGYGTDAGKKILNECKADLLAEKERLENELKNL